MTDGWTFLSNHGHVLVCLSLQPDVRLRDAAQQVGITERAVQQIVSDLEAAGYVEKSRTGRRNHYRIRRTRRFRHPLENQVRVGDFIDLVAAAPASSPSPSSRASGLSSPS
jgi:predicted transcriptional regulator